MIERRPRVLRNEKLDTSGNPDRKIPLWTIEKFKGGIKLSSSAETSTNGVAESPADGGGRDTLLWSTLATSIIWKISLPSSSSSSALVNLFIVFSISFILKKKQALDRRLVLWKVFESKKKKLKISLSLVFVISWLVGLWRSNGDGRYGSTTLLLYIDTPLFVEREKLKLWLFIRENMEK